MTLTLKYLFLFVSLPVILISAQKSTKDVIGFPEYEENENLLNKQNRHPVFLPSMCPDNQLFYPGDQKDDWICDCRPGYLYHPKTDFCWPAFRRGPCPQGQYLILPAKVVVPVCEQNPCVVDNLVPWSGRCEVLGSRGPCGEVFPPEVLWVNSTTISITCIPYNIDNGIIKVFNTHNVATKCTRGCKRSIENKCY